ncbi:MAG: hypothetical protein ACLP7J_20950 [Streptosporangiaceae bacterium]
MVQINTGTGCHLDAAIIARGLRALDPPAGSVVVIENAGNLVCPRAQLLRLSSTAGSRMAAWYDWPRGRASAAARLP